MSGLVESSADARSKTIGQNFRVRAWVAFDGGSYTSTNSGNVTSVTDPGGGAGRYQVNFSTPMPNTGYVVVVSDNHNNSNFTTGANRGFNMVRTRATSSVQGQTFEDGGTPVDVSAIFLAVIC